MDVSLTSRSETISHNIKNNAASSATLLSSAALSRIVSTVTVKRPLKVPGLIAIIYFSVCGGPFGSEVVVSAAGPFIALSSFIVLPIVWSVPMALVAAELSTTFPTNSGFTAWVTAAFGPFWGFVEGFLSWLSGAVNCAIHPALVLSYLKHICPALRDDVHGYFFVVILSAALSLLSFRGLDVVGWSTIILGFFTMTPFLFIVPAAFIRMEPHNLLSMPNSLQEVDWMNYLSVLFWNNNFWDSASCLAGEVQDARTTFPIALFWAFILVFASYLLPLAAGIALSGKGEGFYWGDWDSGSFATLGMITGGVAVEAWVVMAAAVSNVGQFLSEQAECSFQVQDMAEKGWLPESLSTKSIYGTPTVGIMICFLIVWSLATFDFVYLVELLNSIYCIAQLLEFAAFLKLRYSHPSLHRPFRVPLQWTFSCAVMLLGPIAFCIVILVLPFLQQDVFQIAVLLGTPLFAMLLHCFFESCRRKNLIRFVSAPPMNLDEVLLMVTPPRSFARARSGSDANSIRLSRVFS